MATWFDRRALDVFDASEEREMREEVLEEAIDFIRFAFDVDLDRGPLA